jgi:hypothetical protein
MSQIEYATDRKNWWERLFGSLMTRAEKEMQYELPPDSLFNGTWNGANSLADVPEQLKAQIREEALLTAFNRLESSLRLLLYATTPGKEPPTAERCHQILNVWRYELEHRVNLTPDTYCGAVQRYGAEMDDSYTIDGACQPGDLLRIRVPCWRMNERIVVRGEAELVDEDELNNAATLTALDTAVASAVEMDANGISETVASEAKAPASEAKVPARGPAETAKEAASED